MDETAAQAAAIADVAPPLQTEAKHGAEGARPSKRARRQVKAAGEAASDAARWASALGWQRVAVM